MYSQHRGMETYKHKEKDIQIFFFFNGEQNNGEWDPCIKHNKEVPME